MSALSCAPGPLGRRADKWTRQTSSDGEEGQAVVWALPAPRPEPLCQVRPCRRRRSTCRRALHACVARGTPRDTAANTRGLIRALRVALRPPADQGQTCCSRAPHVPMALGRRTQAGSTPPRPGQPPCLSPWEEPAGWRAVSQLDPKSQAQERGAGSGLEARKHTTRHLAHDLLPHTSRGWGTRLPDC